LTSAFSAAPAGFFGAAGFTSAGFAAGAGCVVVVDPGAGRVAAGFVGLGVAVGVSGAGFEALGVAEGFVAVGLAVGEGVGFGGVAAGRALGVGVAFGGGPLNRGALPLSFGFVDWVPEG